MTIRPALPADAGAIAITHVASWQSAYRGLLPDELLDNLSVEQRRQFWERLLAEGNTSVLVNATCATGAHSNADRRHAL